MIDVESLWTNRQYPTKLLTVGQSGQETFSRWTNAAVQTGKTDLLGYPQSPTSTSSATATQQQQQQQSSESTTQNRISLPRNSSSTTASGITPLKRLGSTYPLHPDYIFSRSLLSELGPPKLPHKQDNQNAVVMSREEALVTLSEKTSYPILQENGQRRYGPPPDWKGPQPPRGCEVFIGKIPRDCFEDELVPIFEIVGRIYMFRLMMDFSGCNRGYGFCIYTNREDTRRAVAELDSYEIRRGKMLGVCFSVDNCRLFVGGIPKTKTKDEIMTEMLKVTEGVKDVIVYPSVADKTKNRGFAFVEYENHKAAAMARRKLIPGRIHLWGHQIAVDWAEPEREVDEDIMSKVRILYVRNLMLHTTEEALRDHFNRAVGSCDAVERVKKIRDYAFVHFRDRMQAAAALRQLDGTTFEGSQIEVTWAKPVDKNDGFRLSRNSNSGLTPSLTTVPNYMTNSGQLAGILDTRAVGNPLSFNIFGVPMTDPQLRLPLAGYCNRPPNAITFNSYPTALTPQLAAIKMNNGFQPFGKISDLSGMNSTILNNGIPSTNFNTLALVRSFNGQTTPGLLDGTNVLSTFRGPIQNGLQQNLLHLNQQTRMAQLQNPNGDTQDVKSLPESLSTVSRPVQSSVDNKPKEPECPKPAAITPETNELLNKESIKLLADVCIRHGLGMPKITMHTQEVDDPDSGHKVSMSSVQIFLSSLNRRFTSPSPASSVDEAAKTAANATLQWLVSHYLLLKAPHKPDQPVIPSNNHPPILGFDSGGDTLLSGQRFLLASAAANHPSELQIDNPNVTFSQIPEPISRGCGGLQSMVPKYDITQQGKMEQISAINRLQLLNREQKRPEGPPPLMGNQTGLNKTITESTDQANSSDIIAKAFDSNPLHRMYNSNPTSTVNSESSFVIERPKSPFVCDTMTKSTKAQGNPVPLTIGVENQDNCVKVYHPEENLRTLSSSNGTMQERNRANNSTVPDIANLSQINMVGESSRGQDMTLGTQAHKFPLLSECDNQLHVFKGPYSYQHEARRSLEDASCKQPRGTMFESGNDIQRNINYVCADAAQDHDPKLENSTSLLRNLNLNNIIESIQDNTFEISGGVKPGRYPFTLDEPNHVTELIGSNDNIQSMTDKQFQGPNNLDVNTGEQWLIRPTTIPQPKTSAETDDQTDPRLNSGPVQPDSPRLRTQLFGSEHGYFTF
ncbi:unnamed protein product [Calicophoron daubneyi]|uniref:RRM domain-containing protein n=1 Tax=Calicophoron daubneyi TaxID=300641 RepID=A0AAV2TIZ1_CALDB